jgi:hypothetical protein
MVVTFVVSDLARQRREVVDAARREPVRIRDTDGSMLVLTTEDQELAKDRILGLYELHVRAQIECRGERPRAAVLGELGFIADWSADERNDFLDGLAEALGESLRLLTPAPADFFLSYHRPLSKDTPVQVQSAFIERLSLAVSRRGIGAA